MPVIVDQDVCIGCGTCCGVCPTSAITMNGDSMAECDGDTCIDCAACVSSCPVSAISQ